MAEYAVEWLAAALNLSHLVGLALVSEAVGAHRLPRLWTLVQDGRLQAWKARQVAKATTQLVPGRGRVRGPALAVTGRHNRLPALNPVLHEARLRCDPDQAAAVEQNALAHRGVWLDHRESTATTLLTARMDTLDALDLDGSITDLAGLMGRLGDHRDLDVRRVGARDAGTSAARSTSPRSLEVAAGGLNGSRGTVYLHVSLADLATHSGSSRVERLGTASLALLRDWLQRTSG